MTVNQTPYGAYTHGKPHITSERSWVRWDDWLSNSGEKGGDRLFCAGPNDDTPIHSKPYGFKCSCCFLGFAHTEAYHAKAEGVADERR